MAPFSSEFEFLCSELSMICLRIKFWGDSHGLSFDIDNLPATLTTTPELESTTTQCIATMINVLTEVETIRQKYEYQRPLHPCASSMKEIDIRTLQPSPALAEISRSRAVTRLRRRIRENQKQKSCLNIAKWNMVDGRKFEDKIGKLRTLICGLECISAPVSRVQSRTLPPSSPGVSDMDPPAYSSRIQSASPQFDLEQDSYEQHTEESFDNSTESQYSDSTEDSQYGSRNSLIPRTYFPASDLAQDVSTEIQAHYTAMILYCGPTNTLQSSPRPIAQQRLFLLSDLQFEDLRTDIHDEISRRENCHSDYCPPLSSTAHYTFQRNYARARLANLDTTPFKDLVVDLVFEIERRYPSLVCSQSQSSIANQSQTPIFASCPRTSRPPTIRSVSADSVLYRHQDRDTLYQLTSSLPVPTHNHGRSQSYSQAYTGTRRQRSPPPPLQFRSPHPSTRSGSIASEISIFEPDTPPMTPSTPITICASPRTPTQHSSLASPFTPFSPETHPNPLSSAPISPFWAPQASRSTSRSPSSLSSFPPYQEQPASPPTPNEPSPITEQSDSSEPQPESFHITPSSTTSQILPLALKTYAIPSRKGEHSLYIVWGEDGEYERRLDEDEFPLEVFRGLEEEGGKPGFVLRRADDVVVERRDGEEEGEGEWEGKGMGGEGEGDWEVDVGEGTREHDGWAGICWRGSEVRQSAIGVGY